MFTERISITLVALMKESTIGAVQHLTPNPLNLAMFVKLGHFIATKRFIKCS